MNFGSFKAIGMSDVFTVEETLKAAAMLSAFALMQLFNACGHSNLLDQPTLGRVETHMEKSIGMQRCHPELRHGEIGWPLSPGAMSRTDVGYHIPGQFIQLS